MTTEELRAMPLHKTVCVFPDTSSSLNITRLPGGWGYERFAVVGYSHYLKGSWFVPDPLERAAVEIAAALLSSHGKAYTANVTANASTARQFAAAVLEEVGK